MKILTLVIIIAGASYVYYEMPDARIKKSETCKYIYKRSACSYKENAEQKDK